MAEGSDMQACRQTAALLAMTANVNRDRKKRRTLFVPAEFNPYATDEDIAAQQELVRSASKGGVPVTPSNIDMLKVMLPHGGA